jgi:hypothetical protein
MTTELELIARLKNASTVPQMAHATALLLRACGIFNYQGVAQELARISVTNDGDGFGTRLKEKDKQ